MPTIERIGDVKIQIYADDHEPPHFHLRAKGWSLWVDISTMKIERGKGPRGAADEALAWARANKAELMTKWREYNERD